MRKNEDAKALIDISARLAPDELARIFKALAERIREESSASRLLVVAADCADMRQIRGATKTYWYSSEHMTDSYARWAMLALEDDIVQTLVSCAREESRVYPRPLYAAALGNAPFNLSLEQLEQAYQRVRESGEFPDIERVVASNGDVYFFSTDHLTKIRAQVLAEYNSVDVFLNV
jgi:hypothetical protein